MIVPHRPPFLFVSEIVSGEGANMRVVAKIPRDCPYADGEKTPRTLLVEALAQGMAAHATKTNPGEHQRGVLAMVKNVAFKSDVAPGENFYVDVTLRRIFGKLRYYFARAENAEGQIVCEGEVVAATVPE